MPKYQNIHEAVADNSSKQCSIQGCLKSRHGFSRYCKSHLHQSSNWGHPLASQVRLKDFESERHMTEKVIDLNLEDHEGIKYGLEFLDKLLLTCSQGTSFVPYADFLASLQAQGVTSKEILVTLSALYLLYDGRSRLVKGDTHLTYLLGNFVLRMGKQPWRVYGAQRKAIGEYLQEHVGSLCLNISKAAQEMVLQRDKALLDMCKPLVLE